MRCLFAAVYTLHMGVGESLCSDICKITRRRLDNSAGKNCPTSGPLNADQLARHNNTPLQIGVDPYISSHSLKNASFPPPSKLLLDLVLYEPAWCFGNIKLRVMT